MKAREFMVHVGMTTPRGKPTWPDMVTLMVPIKDALKLIAQLANALQHRDDYVDVTLVGELSKPEEDQSDG